MKISARMVLILTLLLLPGYSPAVEPLAVSPGSGNGSMAVIGQNCPTFSWAPAEGAVAYQLTVYTDPATDTPPHEEMARVAGPILNRHIPAPALSWTPAAGECLAMGAAYIWYVGGIDAQGQTTWSPGMVFEVSAAAISQDVEDAIQRLAEVYLAESQAVPEILREIEIQLASDVAPRVVGGGHTVVGVEPIAEADPTGNYFAGYSAAFTATSASYDTVVGYNAGYFLTTGNYNTIFGSSAGHSIQGGSRNTFLGSGAALLGQDVDDNICIGYKAGYDVAGNWNIYIGNLAGSNGIYDLDNTGNQNVFVGHASGKLNFEGSYNTFVGLEAGRDNTDGDENLFIGKWAGLHNSIGTKNTFVGKSAGYKNTLGAGNVFVGYGAGNLSLLGYYNTYIGTEAGFNNEYGQNNVFIGNRAGKSETGSHKLYIANSDTTKPLIWGDFIEDRVKVYGQLQLLGAAAASDRRFKKDIRPLTASLDKILQLEGVGYQWNIADYPDWGFKPGRQVGLIAQEVEAVMPELVKSDKDGYKSVSYQKLTAVLVEAIKELQNETDGLARQIRHTMADQQAELTWQQARIDDLMREIDNPAPQGARSEGGDAQ